jgi:hypothetical protein
VKPHGERILLENTNISENTKISSDKRKSNKCLICECGAKINLSYDAKQMGKTIVSHAKEHAKKKSDDSSSNAEASRIEYLLTEQVFTAIGSIEQP